MFPIVRYVHLFPLPSSGSRGRSLRKPCGSPPSPVPSHLRILLFQAFPSAITTSAVSISFLGPLLRSLQRVSLFVVFFGTVDDHGSPVILRSVSVRPTHLFDPSFQGCNTDSISVTTAEEIFQCGFIGRVGARCDSGHSSIPRSANSHDVLYPIGLPRLATIWRVRLLPVARCRSNLGP